MAVVTAVVAVVAAAIAVVVVMVVAIHGAGYGHFGLMCGRMISSRFHAITRSCLVMELLPGGT